jgi:hypothetical protein
VLAIVLFVAAVVSGTILDARARERVTTRRGPLLVADLHVHPYPGDGSLTIAQLQREAVRRGIDVIAITGHNNQFGLSLSRLLGSYDEGPIILPGQEVTSAHFHMIAAGIATLVDWRLPANAAIAVIQSRGGVAIAAHPIALINSGWDPPAQRLLDGAEVMHPLRLGYTKGGRELDNFFETTRGINPSVAAIGSTDFHMSAPLGLCRTYIATDNRTAGGVLAAIREGRTAAACGDKELVGETEAVDTVRKAIASLPAGEPPSSTEKLCAFLALAALALLATPPRR